MKMKSKSYLLIVSLLFTIIHSIYQSENEIYEKITFNKKQKVNKFTSLKLKFKKPSSISKKDKLLNDESLFVSIKYLTDLENSYIVRNHNKHNNYFNTIIKDYFSNFLNNENSNYLFNLSNNQNIICKVPVFNKSIQIHNKTMRLSTFQSSFLLHEIINMCYNKVESNKYFKVCPFNSASIVNFLNGSQNIKEFNNINIESENSLGKRQVLDGINDYDRNTKSNSSNNSQYINLDKENNFNFTNYFIDEYYNQSGKRMNTPIEIYISGKILRFNRLSSNHLEKIENYESNAIVNISLLTLLEEISKIHTFSNEDYNSFNTDDTQENNNNNTYNMKDIIYNQLLNYITSKDNTNCSSIISKYMNNINNNNLNDIEESCLKLEISYRRRIRFTSNNIIVLSSTLPINNIVIYNIFFETEVKKRLGNNSLLEIVNDIILCSSCEFVNLYKENDLFIVKKNILGREKEKGWFNEEYQVRLIRKIYDNKIMEVDIPFEKDCCNGYFEKNKYYVLSFEDRIRRKISQIKDGSGYIHEINSEYLITKGGKFTNEVSRHDHILNINKIIDTYIVTSKDDPSLKINVKQEKLLKVNYVSSDNLLSFIPNNENNKEIMINYFHLLNAKYYQYLIIRLNENENENEKGNSYIEIDNKLRFDINIPTSIVFNERNLNKIFKENTFIEDYIVHNDLTLKFSIENINSTAGILSIIFMDENKKGVYQLLIDNRYGIIIKNILHSNHTSNHEDISFYKPKINDLYTFSNKFIIFIDSNNNLLSMTSQSWDNLNRIRVSHHLPVKIKSFKFDYSNTINVNLKRISKFNYLLDEYEYYMNLWKLRLSLDESVSYEEVFENGEVCEEDVKERRFKSIIKYSCDESGVYDFHFEDVLKVDQCTYEFKVKSILLCNPDHMRLSILNSQGFGVECEANINEKIDMDIV